MKRYVIINFRFDAGAFAADLSPLIPLADRAHYAAVIGVDHSTLDNWINQRAKLYQYLNMTHFLAACNALDLDPREYFRMEGDV